VRLRLDADGGEIDTTGSRRANLNGRAPIIGGTRRRDWFEMNFEPMCTFNASLGSKDVMSLLKP
jgi:hypothetical protein